jgi:peptidyl-prolyl cis-trans isomerase B (cyclophilin B)
MKNLILSCTAGILLFTVACHKPVGSKAAKTVQKETVKDYYIQMTTTQGIIKLKLYNETPLHRDNFVKLVKEGFYDSLLFHRVIKGFMIQGGDPDSKKAQVGQMLGMGDVGYKIPAEFSPELIHKKGVLAAARDNNPEKASSGCQFYIVQGKTYDEAQLDNMQRRVGWIYTPGQRDAYKNIGGTPMLDNNYTVFGEVLEGIEVVDAIAGVKTNPMDRPEVDVRILKCKLVKN